MYISTKNKKDFDLIQTYLKKEKILFKSTACPSIYIINIINNDLEPKEIDYFKKELNIEFISIENGYLTSKNYKEKSTINIGDLVIGGNKPIFISGPCCIESEDQIISIAKEVKKYGANILRGGAYKPRTSPYDFQGLEKEGLDLLYKAKQVTGLPIISELMDIKYIDIFLEDVDIIQIGSRNMQNYHLLKEIGKVKKPVMLKRGLASTIKELLLCAEYIMANGNENVMLCERGIRTFEKYTRNTMDVACIPLLKELSHLPIIADPSHATGKRSLIKPMTLASIASGVDGIMIESHNNPDLALCDGPQSIYPSELKEIIEKSIKIHSII
ncbi:3-deoxy-7-phosphoheptulonate synthase [Romboutsia lituseburensis]|uniref:3-deoxy-7-phosphoheptulonate synthase n=1 Tax=Romboutsia lituseburensis TaxID=1537 RepID=UPI00215ADE48|nr:3-deoxy-7-phosphoheptulonate synthase [Romboutsia lituseburensis]MCR8746643.1 3-deoxy-7-phosphoheptulonate synthase [Romboutsia lituseburensis]